MASHPKVTYVCGDDRPVPDTSDCPNSAEHTPCPTGYVDWHEWAASMHYQRRTQHKCPGCGLLKIWR
jgi:hypothetical protein